MMSCMWRACDMHEVMHVTCLGQYQAHREELITYRGLLYGRTREEAVREEESMKYMGRRGALNILQCNPGAVVASVSPTLRGTQK